MGSRPDSRSYEKAVEKTKGYHKTLRQAEFEKEHPEVAEVYSHIEEFQHYQTLQQEKEKEGKKQKSENLDRFSFLFN